MAKLPRPASTSTASAASGGDAATPVLWYDGVCVTWMIVVVFSLPHGRDVVTSLTVSSGGTNEEQGLPTAHV